jgi:hypothetical protein
MISLPQRYGIEQNRIEFMFNRDGLEGCMFFAIQTMKIYRKSFFVRDRNNHKLYCHDKAYRRSFIEGYLAFKRFYFDYKGQRELPTSHESAQSN